MRAAALSGGRVAAVLADSLEKAVLNRENRPHLMDHRMVLVSPYDPAAGFNVGNAMNRNKLIYGLADAALVVSCTLEQGGTWAGATEQLKKYHFGPVFVRATHKPDRGLQALQRLGALLWPNIVEPGAFLETLTRESDRAVAGTSQPELAMNPPAVAEPEDVHAVQEADSASTKPWSEQLLDSVRVILGRAESPMTEQEIATELDVSTTQARVWLRKLVEEGSLEKLQRPVRYRSSRSGNAQKSLFAQP